MLLASGFIEFKLDYDQIQHLATGDSVSSDNFSAGDYLWRINCYPRGDVIDGNNEHLSVNLELVSKSKKVDAIFDAFLVCRDGQLLYSPTNGCLNTFDLTDKEWGLHQFVKRSELELWYVMNGTVTIVCRVTVVHDDSTLPVPPPSNLASHLGHLLDCTRHSSWAVRHSMLTVLCSQPDHQSSVLSSLAQWLMPQCHPSHCRTFTLQHSKLCFGSCTQYLCDDRFEYAIHHRCLESNTLQHSNMPSITDALPPDDELGDSPVEMLQHLLAVADRFALDRLKVLCELKLWDNTSVTTVASVLACAETYNCPKLKTKCMNFFAVQENFYKAVFTDGFAMLLQKFPALAVELRKRVGNGDIRPLNLQYI